MTKDEVVVWWATRMMVLQDELSEIREMVAQETERRLEAEGTLRGVAEALGYRGHPQYIPDVLREHWVLKDPAAWQDLGWDVPRDG